MPRQVRAGVYDHSGDPKQQKIDPFKGKNTAENTAKIWFLTFLTFFVVFGPFLTSWRPGNACKGFLEVVRWISIEYEPVTSHQTPKSSIFDVFGPYFFPTDQHFSKKSIPYASPGQATRWKLTANGFSSFELSIKIFDYDAYLQCFVPLFTKKRFFNSSLPRSL